MISKVGFDVTRDSFSDSYIYTYPSCGHQIHVPGTRMARGGQVVPPICPQCHGQAVIDKMEAEQWRRDPGWTGFVSTATPYISTNIRSQNSSSGALIRVTGNVTWLDLELNRVTKKARLH